MADLLSLKIYDSDNGDLLNDFDSPYRYGRCSLVFSPDGTLLARTGTDKSIPIWNTQSSTLIADLPSESHIGSFSEDQLWFAAGLSDESNGIHLWKLPAQRIGASPENPNADKKLPWQAVGRVVDGKGNSLSPNTTVVSHNDSRKSPAPSLVRTINRWLILRSSRTADLGPSWQSPTNAVSSDSRSMPIRSS